MDSSQKRSYVVTGNTPNKPAGKKLRDGSRDETESPARRSLGFQHLSPTQRVFIHYSLVELKRQPKISLVLPTNITRTVKLNLEGSENCCLNGISAILYILKLPRDKERMKARSWYGWKGHPPCSKSLTAFLILLPPKRALTTNLGLINRWNLECHKVFVGFTGSL